jgi:uncharacterized membrane protein YdjX (TVP38/TMEM64 family)
MSVSSVLAPANELFAHHPLLTIGGFCLLHLTASAISIPGSCTLLNTLSGAVFGFWRGCALVYPITALSAALMYAFGARFTFKNKYTGWVESLRKHLAAGDYLFFVGLRLSPLLPFGVLNALMGLARVPFRLYMLTTIVGIFFDVTLLNALGANLHAETPVSHQALIVAFVVLFLTLFIVRVRLAKVLRA